MTTKEFSDAFDTLLNSAGGGVSLDEYEKSLFLTQAQEQIVIELYTGRNNIGASFEETEEIRSSLRSLIKTEPLTESAGEFKGISKYSKFFTLPSDVLYITYESATLSDKSAGCKDGSDIPVIPVTQDEFDRVMNNPFRGPSKRKALRLDNGSNIVEIITKYNIKNYTIRYLSKPAPIVLAELEDVSVGSDIVGCKLDSATHMYILERAVTLALASKGVQSGK